MRRLLQPYYAFKTWLQTIRAMKVRNKPEILAKKKEFEEKYLTAQRTKQKDDMVRYEAYVKVINWVTYGE
jgi:hypothetical protein